MYCVNIYQIKGDETYDNMQANILPLYTPRIPGGLKGKIVFLLKLVKLHIKLRRRIAMYDIFCIYNSHLHHG